MAANKVRGDYDQLNEIAQTFSRQTESVRKLVNNIQTAKTTLENGDWVGKGADKFYKEMNSAVLPSLGRLVNALDTASRTTQQISRIIRQAEDDAAAVLRGDGGGATGTGEGAATAGRPAGVEESHIHAFGPTATSAASSLADRIRNMRGNRTPADPAALLQAIQQASPEERRAILSDRQLMATINASLGASGLGLATVAAMFQGQLKWSGTSGPDSMQGFQIRSDSDFGNWIRARDENQKPPNIATGSMNCWELIMFSAYKMGQVSYQQLVELHDRAAAAGRKVAESFGIGSTILDAMGTDAYKRVIADAMGATNAQQWFQGIVPPAGSVVFFDYDGKGPLTHVAISLGTLNAKGQVEVMSLWHGVLAQRTTIEHLANRIEVELEKDYPKITYGKPTFR